MPYIDSRMLPYIDSRMSGLEGLVKNQQKRKQEEEGEDANSTARDENKEATGEAVILDIYCLPSHETLELGVTSKLTNLDKLKRLTEIKIGDNVVSHLIIDGEFISDYEQSIGDFLIKSSSTSACFDDGSNVSIGGYERIKIYAYLVLEVMRE